VTNQDGNVNEDKTNQDGDGKDNEANNDRFVNVDEDVKGNDDTTEIKDLTK
jgi:hypothetical protein